MYSRIIPGRLNRRDSGRRPFNGNFASLFPGAYQVLQSDRGLTYGGALLANAGNTSTATMALTGTLTTTPVPIWIRLTGAGITGDIYYDGTGVTPAMTGVTVLAGNPILLTGAGTGLSLTPSAGTLVVGDTWKATCAALADQSLLGLGNHAVQVAAASQPLVTVGVNGVACVANPSIAAAKYMTTAALNLPATTTPTMALVVFRALSWTANARLVGETAAANHRALLQLSGASPALMQYDGAPGNISTDLAIGAWGICEAVWGNSTTDYIRLGAAAPVTGTSCGNAGVGSGRQIFATGGANYGAYEIAALIYTPVVSTAPFRAAVAAKYSGLVSG